MSDKPKNNNLFKIVIIVLLVLILVGGTTFGAVYYFNKKNSTETPKPKVITEVTYSLGDFLINLLDDGRRYLKVNVYIGYEVNKDLTIELEANKPIIRDAVNTLIRSKKTTDFSDEGLVAIKKELIASINPILTKGKITNIYFNDILVQ